MSETLTTLVARWRDGADKDRALAIRESDSYLAGMARGKHECADELEKSEPTALIAPPVGTWQPIETAPKVHLLDGGPDLLLGWNAPGINEWIQVVGCWRDGWFYGEHKAYPTHWQYAPLPPAAPGGEG